MFVNMCIIMYISKHVIVIWQIILIQFLQGRVAESGVMSLKGAKNMREKQRRRKPTKQEGEGININRSCELDRKREEDGEAREKQVQILYRPSA